MNSSIKTDPMLPQIGKELLSKLSSSSITMKEFDKECAYWMMGDISTMYYKIDDIHKPEIIVNYEDNKTRDPKYEVASNFWQRPDVKDYIIQTHEIRSKNHSNFHWLHFMKKHIPKEDTINRGKIERALASYGNGVHVVNDEWTNR